MRSKTYLFAFALLAVALLIGLLIASGLLKAPVDPPFRHAAIKPTYYTSPCLPEKRTKPVAPTNLQVQVFNTTDESGLANKAADELKNLRVHVALVGNSSSFIDEPAQIRTSVQSLPQAYSLAELIPGAKVVVVPTSFKHSKRLDLLLGDGFSKVITRSEYAKLDSSRQLNSPDGCTAVDPQFIAEERAQIESAKVPASPSTPTVQKPGKK